MQVEPKDPISLPIAECGSRKEVKHSRSIVAKELTYMGDRG